MDLRPEEVSAIIKQQIDKYGNKSHVDDVGYVLQAGMVLRGYTGSTTACPESFWSLRTVYSNGDEPGRG